mgnify:CR=1 FL=1
MRPIEIRLRNIGPFLDQTINFDNLDNMFLITGNTGAGKTFIFDAMTYALYGELKGNRASHEKDLKSRYASENETEFFVDFTFKVADKIYKVIRTVEFTKPGNKNPTASDVEVYSRQNNGDFECITSGKSKKEKDELIKNLIGLTVSEFSQVILLPQGEFSDFLKQNSSQRSVTLKKLFPVDDYSRLMEKAKEKKGTAPVKIKKISENGEAIKISVENAATQIKVDAQTVGNISKAMQEAVQNDLSLVNSQINALTSINFKDMASLFSGELDGPVLQMLRKYMPVAQTVLAKVEEFQTYGRNKEKQPKKEKTETNRLAGRTIEYRADTIPDVLIRKISLSGVLPKNNWGVYGTINNISSDCNKLNKPIDIKMGLSRNGSETETLSALIDMRNNRKVKAFTASLSSKGWAFNNLTIPNAGNLGNVSAAAMAAIPALSGLANFNAEIGIDTDLSFDINGGVNVLNAILDIKPFEPAFAYSLYSRAIEILKNLI